MTRFLSIHPEPPPPYGGVMRRAVPCNMKFAFVMAVVMVAACCDGTGADAGRILNNYKYLEYLNDLDRRNVELEYDMHKQWPFHVFKGSAENMGNEVENNNPNAENLMKIKEIVDMAREQMINRHHQNHFGKILDRFDHGYKHMRDATERANQLSQYLRYKSPSGQERLEEVRMYPQEEDFTFNDENDSDNKYGHGENRFDLNENDDVAENEGTQILPEGIFQPEQVVEGSVNREANDIEPGHHQEHEDYKFRDGEEFPHSVLFSEVPMADDPSEFGVGPSDIRFFRDISRPEKEEKGQEEVTLTPKSDIFDDNNVEMREPKPKIAARSDTYSQAESFTLNQGAQLGSADKDVEVVPFKPDMTQADTAGVYIIAVVAGISAAATVGLIAVGIGWYNLQKHMKNAEDADYPSYGIVGPNKEYEKKERDDAGDRRLAQSAQMYHYQHQKQQIIAMGRNPPGGHGSQSDTEEEEDEEGNYTVYECPGLASIEGPLEVKNPMFDDDQLATPSQTPSKPTNAEDNK